VLPKNSSVKNCNFHSNCLRGSVVASLYIVRFSQVSGLNSFKNF